MKLSFQTGNLRCTNAWRGSDAVGIGTVKMLLQLTMLFCKVAKTIRILGNICELA